MENLPLDPTVYKTLLEFAPCFTMLVFSLVKIWFITSEETASMLAALRRAGLVNQFYLTSASPDELHKIIQFLTDRLVRASSNKKT